MAVISSGSGYRSWDAVQTVCMWCKQPSGRAGEGEAENHRPHAQAHLPGRHGVKRGWDIFTEDLFTVIYRDVFSFLWICWFSFLSQATVNMFYFQRQQTESVPLGYQNLELSCRPCDAGEPYLLYISGKSLSGQPLQNFIFQEFIPPGKRWENKTETNKCSKYLML